eukprot:6453651-Pyramimonas_sp.AAC.1
MRPESLDPGAPPGLGRYAQGGPAAHDWRARDLLPLPLPPPPSLNRGSSSDLSRASRRRLERSVHSERLVRDIAQSLNDLFQGSSCRGGAWPSTAAQDEAVRRIRLAVQRIGPPPDGLDGAGALRELCARRTYG